MIRPKHDFALAYVEIFYFHQGHTGDDLHEE